MKEFLEKKVSGVTVIAVIFGILGIFCFAFIALRFYVEVIESYQSCTEIVNKAINCRISTYYKSIYFNAEGRLNGASVVLKVMESLVFLWLALSAIFTFFKLRTGKIQLILALIYLVPILIINYMIIILMEIGIVSRVDLLFISFSPKIENYFDGQLILLGALIFCFLLFTIVKTIIYLLTAAHKDFSSTQFNESTKNGSQ